MLSLLLMLVAQVVGQDVTTTAPGVCAAASAEVLVGNRYRRGVPTKAKRLSGARVVRVVMPGEMVTQDWREDRLTMRVDHRRVITSVRCG